ncbi:MAG: glycosyltransferase family 2 protein [Phycisphaerales bacterium]
MPRSDQIELSIIAPAHNEAENIGPLIKDIVAALGASGIGYEIIVVDDGSTDTTLAELQQAQRLVPQLRVLRMADTPAGRGHGQSAAFHAAFRAARGDIIAMLDADLQNDPSDIPSMLARMTERNADMVQGDRSAARRDTFMRRFASRLSRWYRRGVLGDTIRDTACSLRVLRRDVALQLPLEFRGQHRFIPLTTRALGYVVVEMPVHHRPRVAGNAKYGIFDRLLPGVVDCFAVRWMLKRRRPVQYEEVPSDSSGSEQS